MSVTEVLNQHDCWDLGGGVNSIEWALGNYGINKPIAINPGDKYRRVDDLQEREFPVLKMSAVDLPSDAYTDVIAMSHMLEHVTSAEDRIKIINYALDHARKMVVILGPYFSEDTQMREDFKLKFNWGDWSDHESRYDLHDITHEVLQPRGMFWPSCYTISRGHAATHTDDPNVFHLDEPKNQGDYDPEIHLPKPSYRFPYPIYKEFMLIIPRCAMLREDIIRIHKNRHEDGALHAWSSK